MLIRGWSILLSLFVLVGTVTEMFAQRVERKYTKKECYDLSYAFGAQMGQSLKEATMLTEAEKNVDGFVKGFAESLKGNPLTLAEAKEAMQIRMQSQTQSATPEEAAKIAYNIGLTSGLGDIAQKVKLPTSWFNLRALKKGYEDAIKGKELKMTRPEMDEIFQLFLEPKAREYQKIVEAEMEGEAAVVVKAGQAFLAENKKKEGVITTESGLQYEIIQEGTGIKPKLTDKVKTHYHGTLIDGTVFDSSIDRNQPATFPVNGVIRGWQEGIPMMSEGAKYRFYIPQELAYGLQSPTPKIPAGSVLIFDVELLAVNPED